MPKAILEFDLPTESIEHYDALKGSHYRCIIEETLNLIRNKLKYGNLQKEQEELLEEIRDSINEAMGEK